MRPIAGWRRLMALGLASFIAVPWSGTGAADDLAKGEHIYARQCLVCHRLEVGEHRIGPALHGMFDRPSGTAPGFMRYSQGLKNAALAWDDATLHRYLQNPRGMIADNRMIFVGLQSEADRQAVIAYMRATFD